MRRYKQISYEERIKIGDLKQSGLSIGQIALKVSRSKSTISRELKRNQAPLSISEEEFTFFKRGVHSKNIKPSLTIFHPKHGISISKEKFTSLDLQQVHVYSSFEIDTTSQKSFDIH